jgi:type VI protein secretion system component VasK
MGQRRLEKAMAQSDLKPSAASRKMILGLAVIAAAVGLLAWQLYETGNADTFRSVLASNLLQGGAIAIGVIVIGWLVERSADRQADRLEVDRKRQADKLELDRKRLELLQRMRAAHVSIAHAQRLIRAEDDDTYMEQMRALMLVARGLEAGLRHSVSLSRS